MAATRLPVLELLLTLASVALLAILLYIWLREYAKTKARFTLGLVLFAGVFLAKEVLQVLNVIDRATGLPVIGGRLTLLIAIAEVVALGVLVYSVSR